VAHDEEPERSAEPEQDKTVFLVEWSGSAKNKARSSEKTVAAYLKKTLCFRTFSRFLASSHSIRSPATNALYRQSNYDATLSLAAPIPPHTQSPDTPAGASRTSSRARALPDRRSRRSRPPSSSSMNLGRRCLHKLTNIPRWLRPAAARRFLTGYGRQRRPAIASKSTMNSTAERVPLNTGLPTSIFGSVTIRSCQSMVFIHN